MRSQTTVRTSPGEADESLLSAPMRNRRLRARKQAADHFDSFKHRTFQSVIRIMEDSGRYCRAKVPLGGNAVTRPQFRHANEKVAFALAIS